MRRPALRRPSPWFPLAFALVAALALCAPRRANAQGLTYIDRPLVTTPRHLSLRAGFGLGQCGYCGTSAGLGLNGEMFYGVAGNDKIGLEVGVGEGLRFGYDAVIGGVERYARVNTEWLPSGFALGQDYFTNPYFRLRFAFLNQGPFYMGVEFYHTVPIVNGPYHHAFAFGVGLPIHIALAHRVRIETGAFLEFIATPNNDTFLDVPLRINFQVIDRLWLGVRGGFQMVNWSTSAFDTYFPLGFQGGVRIAPRVDLVWDLVFPEFIHSDSRIDPPHGGTVFFQSWGAGLGVIARVL